MELRLRVGLNSGQVIAGEIGSGSLGYTAVGEQVGMAQRMESVAPPGGVILSASTARLVDGAAALGEPEMVRIKGALFLMWRKTPGERRGRRSADAFWGRGAKAGYPNPDDESTRQMFSRHPPSG